MVKHILVQVLWQFLVLTVLVMAGEFIIPEPVGEYQFDKQTGFVYPGRVRDWFADWPNATELYTNEKMEESGASRHFTFVFATFIVMQWFNMLCSRKVNDELNVFAGFVQNLFFIGTWVVALGSSILIIEVGSGAFYLSPSGLGIE